MRALCLLLAASLVFLVPLGGGLSPAPSLSGVFAIDKGATTLIGWTPEPLASSYQVYGRTAAGAISFITSTPTLSIEVPDTYAAYGVSAMVGGVEGPIKFTDPLCVEISTSPPFVGIYQCRLVAYHLP